ncbi:amidohydrolase [Bacillus pinisoli]|uniref:amidohydrolase n=1 Tax=Bacillus pinisoli TaxID=2901866 RepID=UPI001FF1E889|nr:amidohydrolase [Bacillus pinisoli]
MGVLWFGGKIKTLLTEDSEVEAVYIVGDKIIATGAKDQLMHQYQPDTLMDLEGAVMFPGFVDSHLHLIGHGEKLIRLDLSTLTSSKEIIEALKMRVSEIKHGEWVIGEGWNENQLSDKKIFHAKELDEIAPNNPLILHRICRHAIVANSMALDLAGITSDTKDPAGGVIVRDQEGEPTGYLLDQAQELVKQVIPKVTTDYLEKALRASIQDCHKLGLVGGHSEDLNYYGGFTRTYQTFKNIINKQGLHFKANLLVHHEVVEDMHNQGLGVGHVNGGIEIGAMKIFADGALGGRTALLSQPYQDDPTTSGVANYSEEQLTELVKKARSFNMPVAIHAIGDLAFEYVLNAIELYPPALGQRDRLIHAQILRKDLIERVKKLPVVLDIQPRFVATDFPWVVERLGVERIEYCYAWKTLLNEGIPCSGGSDAPIEPVDPILGIHAAITRANPNEPTITYYPEQALSTFDAIQLFTSGSAFAIQREHERGKIAVGYDADFTILDQDLLTVTPEQILNTNVIMTVVNGEIVYKRKEPIPL